jgi:hypothetical protein
MASVTTPSIAPVEGATAAKRNYGRIAEQTWIWSVVGYSLVRFLIAWGAFSEHGVNAWIFGLIDVGTAWPYGKAIAVVCKRVANGDWPQLAVPLVASIGMFFAPYAYLWFAAGEMPSGMRLSLAIWVSVLFVAAGAGVIFKSRKLRREAHEAVINVREPAEAIVGIAAVNAADDQVVDLRNQGPASELLIDLTGDDVVLRHTTLNS